MRAAQGEACRLHCRGMKSAPSVGEEVCPDKHAWVQEYIARFGHGSAKLARQAQSKEKTLEKMVGGLI